MNLGLTWTDCGKAGDYVVPNVLSPRDLVFRPDNMDKTTHLSDHIKQNMFFSFQVGGCLLLHESSAETSWSFLHYFHTSISNSSL